MKLSSAIKKLEKQGFTVSANGQLHTAKKDGLNQLIEFMKNGHSDEIACIRTKHSHEEDEVMTDYFCGIWHDNITQAIKFIVR